MSDFICLSGALIVDPKNGNSTIRDLWICDGKIVDAPNPIPANYKTYDLTDQVVMPGGVDMHSHIAGPGVNAARMMFPERHRKAPKLSRRAGFRSGIGGLCPTSFATGYLYAGLGYTTVIDAAIPASAALGVHSEFQDIPLIDKGFLTLIGNHPYALDAIKNADHEKLKAFIGWLLQRTRGFGLKVVNPGGVADWAHGDSGQLEIDDAVGGYDKLTPRSILNALALAANELKLPHPIHIHCNKLGHAGNWQTTLNTMRALDGMRAHLTHIQFHSYGGDPNDGSTLCSEAAKLIEYLNSHPELTVDVGQVMFGEAIALTGDIPAGRFLERVVRPQKSFFSLGCDGGCSVIPLHYKDKNLIHALQWAIGLEWYLLTQNPWQIAMSTDHPNGAAFTAYPEIIALLMSRDRREEVLNKLPEQVRQRCQLADLHREYTLEEIAIITRAAPARMLGLKHKGHLGVGADADITVYAPNADKQQMFSMPQMVFKAGVPILKDFELCEPTAQVSTLFTQREHDWDRLNSDLPDWISQMLAINFANFGVPDGHSFENPFAIL